MENRCYRDLKNLLVSDHILKGRKEGTEYSKTHALEVCMPFALIYYYVLTEMIFA